MQAQTQQEQATRDLNNALALQERGVATEDRVSAARAAKAAADAAFTAAQEQLDKTIVRAPFAGRLNDLTLDEGEFVDNGSVVAEVIDNDPLTVVIQVPQQALSRIQTGQTSTVDFITGEQRSGVVSFIGANADQQTRTFRVEVTVDNPDSVMPAGLSARIALPTGQARGHFISPAILSLGTNGELGIKIVEDDNTVAFLPVAIARAQTDGVWITGLPESASIITVGQGFVNAGDLVDPRPIAADQISEICAMNTLIDAAFKRSKVVLLMLAFLLAVGTLSYSAIPKESNPEIPIPIVFVSASVDGISPEDSEDVLVGPLETEFASLTGLKSMTATASEGRGAVQLDFEPGFDAAEALDKVREGADKVENELPSDATVIVTEINTALFPILTVILSGPVPERTLNALAEDLQDDIEALSGVLEVDVGGKRTELLEVLIDPTVFETYNISFNELISSITNNNQLIAAGAIESEAGRLVLKVPGLIGNLEDVMELPILVRGQTVVTFADVATIRRTFEDPTGFARIDSQPALALEIKKRVGANIIETVAEVRGVVEAAQAEWPDNVQVRYTLDESETVKTMLSDLEANVIAAIILVMIVVVYALGLRSSLLVGLAIPGAFLTGVAGLYFMGFTMNIVVLFSLILVVGMLVDGAIVTVELADRYLHEGQSPKEAYARAAKRMAWPIIASTATTLCVFFPLLFWSGTVGEFMKFLPITVIFTLTASLFMALIFIPVMGGLIGKRQSQSAKAKAQLYAAEHGDPRKMTGFMGGYVRVLEWSILRPWTTLSFAMIALVASFVAYGSFGNGLTFFPEVEPDYAQVEVRAKDNFSVYEQDALVRQVEARLAGYDEIASIYARSGGANDGGDTIGTLQLELAEWDTRRPVAQIAEDIRADMAQIPGIDVQVQTSSGGPGGGKPINLEVIGNSQADQEAAVGIIVDEMTRMGGFIDVVDSRPSPGVEWQITVDRSEAARSGANVALVGAGGAVVDARDYRGRLPPRRW